MLLPHVIEMASETPGTHPHQGKKWGREAPSALPQLWKAEAMSDAFSDSSCKGGWERNPFTSLKWKAHNGYWVIQPLVTAPSPGAISSSELTPHSDKN
jgi:hypothetical protein